MAFRVGQEVVCVNASPSLYQPRIKAWHSKSETPVEGQIYTVRAVGWSHGVASIRLNEIKRCECEQCVRMDKSWYGASRFRPVQKRKTDISVFTALLNTKSVEELV